MCENEDLECENKPIYKCRDCGILYCEECAELNDGFCQCEQQSNMIPIDSQNTGSGKQ